MDSRLTKSVGHFEENKFSDGDHQFLLDCCPKLIKTYNFGQNKRQFKNKNEQYCTVRLFNFKVAETFCQFSVRDRRYFLPWLSIWILNGLILWTKTSSNLWQNFSIWWLNGFLLHFMISIFALYYFIKKKITRFVGICISQGPFVIFQSLVISTHGIIQSEKLPSFRISTINICKCQCQVT